MVFIINPYLKKSFCSLFLLLLASCLSETADQTEPIIENEELSLSEMTDIATIDQYNELSDTEKSLVDLINSSINGLKGMSLHSKNKLSDHYATINFKMDNSSQIFSDYVLLSSKESLDYQNILIKFSLDSSCTACGIRTGIKCAKEIASYLKEHGIRDIDIHLHVNDDGCFELTW